MVTTFTTCNAIVEGWSELFSENPRTYQFTLGGILEEDYENGFGDGVGEHNPCCNVFFSRNTIGWLHVALQNQAPYLNDEEDEEEDPFSDTCLPKRDDNKECLLRLNLGKLILGSRSWIAMWNNVATLQNLRRISIDPDQKITRLGLSTISHAIKVVCSMQTRLALSLKPHGHREEPPLDMTTHLVSLMGNGVIYDICVEGNYAVETDQLCSSLERSVSLKRIHLGFPFAMNHHETMKLTQLLIRTMQRSKTFRLESLGVSDDRFLYARGALGGYAVNLPFQNCSDTLNLDHLMRLNQFGIGQLNAKGATTDNAIEHFRFHTENCPFEKKLFTWPLGLATTIRLQSSWIHLIYGVFWHRKRSAASGHFVWPPPCKTRSLVQQQSMP